MSFHFNFLHLVHSRASTRGALRPTVGTGGVYLGVSGRKTRLLVVGKDVVEVHNEWGATRIPLELVEEVLLVLPRDEMVKAVREVQVLGRRVSLRKYRRKEERVRVVVA